MHTTQEVADALMERLEEEIGSPAIKGLPLWSARRLQPPLVAVILTGVEPEAEYLVLSRGVTYYVYSVVTYGRHEHEMEGMVDKMISLFATSNIVVLEDAYAYMTQAVRAERSVDEDVANYGMEFIIQVLQGE